jgi:predicted Na+-dependent transporter
VLKLVVDAGVLALVFFGMVVVGMELTTEDFRRVARQPATVVAATASQFLLLPAIGWLLVRSLYIQPAIAQGMLLVTACPSGATANVYTYLADGLSGIGRTLPRGANNQSDRRTGDSTVNGHRFRATSEGNT